MNAIITSLQQVILRDLDILEKEIKSYRDEGTLWKTEKAINNSAGNLCLHLCGNLQHFIGKVMGHTPYQRDRDREFSVKNVPSYELVEQIEATRVAVKNTLEALDPAALEAEYPLQVFGKPMTSLYFLIHLAGHLNYHLGQINYHRRLLSE
jgi:hypothetical protein